MALTFTEADLENLKQAYVTGATRVKVGDREVEYRSQKDLLEAIKIVEQSLNGISDDIDDNPTVIQAGFSRKPRCDE